MPTELPQRNLDPKAPPPDHGPRSKIENNTGVPQQQDTGAIRLVTIAGIPIRLHITFLLVLSVFALASLRGGVASGGGTATSNPLHTQLLLVIGLFTCVVLHELGHALVAKSYGIRTRDIVLYPIGGVASLETQPRPRQELWIALAGPAVNVLIALALYVGLTLFRVPTGNPDLFGPQPNLGAGLLWTNLGLAAFNMLPAFPMDGGRVLRALLASGMKNEVAATAIAARIGQLLAGICGLYALMSGQFFLLFIAVIVYMGAGQEATAFQTRALISGHRVREAMLREFKTLNVGVSLREAADALLAGSQQDFPIVHGEEVVGVLSRTALMRGIATHGYDSYVAGAMEREFMVADPEEGLETVLANIRGAQAVPILVMEPGATGSPKLVGMLTQENLLEFLMLMQMQMQIQLSNRR